VWMNEGMCTPRVGAAKVRVSRIETMWVVLPGTEATHSECGG
jgi:hypothetical protein